MGGSGVSLFSLLFTVKVCQLRQRKCLKCFVCFLLR